MIREGRLRAAAAALMLAAAVVSVGGLAWAENSTFGPGFVKAPAAGADGRYVAGMELLSGAPQFLQDANRNLQTLHASTVYLYVAYQGQAFFPLPKAATSVGLTEVADTLPAAMKLFHQEKFKVILVVSSALLNDQTAPPAGMAILQPGSDVIDPTKALPLVTQLVRKLSAYKPDGIYVGEPFGWPGDAKIAPATWVSFYQQLHAATTVPLAMLLPTDRDEFASIYKTYGGPLFKALSQSHLFASLGIDAEGMVPRTKPGRAVTTKWLTQSPVEFAVASRRLGGPTAADEIPITDPEHLGTAVPMSLFARAVKAAGTAADRSLVVFSDEYLGAYSSAQRAQMGLELLRFLRGQGLPKAAPRLDPMPPQ